MTNAEWDGLLSLPVTMAETPLGRVEHVSVGDGEALLALHGGMGGRDQGLILARAVLAEWTGRRVIAPSRPGYLGTPQASGATPEAQADLYAALLDALGVERAVVAAVSAGGPSAVQFALRHPGRCRALILVSCCTGPLAVPETLRRRLSLMRWFARFGWLSALMRRRIERDPAGTASRAIPDPVTRSNTLSHPVAGSLMKALQRSPFVELGRRLPGTLNDLDQFERMAALRFDEIAVPLLAIHGTGDRVVPFAHGERGRLATDGELMAVEGGEHVVVFTHLDAIRERVAGFLDRPGI
ncbi:alpha/beta fold hydrolase [Tahibacter caeni]|uniref:alpha/beta fold hydrolase n=1 Tax=Tahibacter caeni TaxID=1453545 RepID=UPI00214980D8|nr:alpha/beta hydrolase [Tahibacter caeni]